MSVSTHLRMGLARECYYCVEMKLLFENPGNSGKVFGKFDDFCLNAASSWLRVEPKPTVHP